MPTVFTDSEESSFDSCVIKRNGYVVGIDRVDGTSVHKHHYPPKRVREIEGDVSYER